MPSGRGEGARRSPGISISFLFHLLRSLLLLSLHVGVLLKLAQVVVPLPCFLFSRLLPRLLFSLLVFAYLLVAKLMLSLLGETLVLVATK